MAILNTSDPEKVRITTGNVMGFIGVGDLQIKIKSRFDEGRDDYLLHYMLQKVFSCNLFDLHHVYVPPLAKKRNAPGHIQRVSELQT